MFGRITVVKSLASSQVIHLMMLDVTPQKYLKILNKSIFNFIWNSKVEKVKRCTLTQDYSQGGLRMIDVTKQILSFRLRWLGRLLDDSEGPWKNMCHYWYNCIGGINLLLHCNYDHKLLDLRGVQLPDFYLEILQAWNYVKNNTNCETGSVQNMNVHKQIIWYNKNIVWNTKSLFYEDWFNCGIVYVQDLFEEGHFVSVEKILARLKTKKSKQNMLFDYSKLKKAILKVWFQNYCTNTQPANELKDSFETPVFSFGEMSVAISDISSKRFYSLIRLGPIFTNRCCLFWENILQTDIYWSSVFKRNLTFIGELRLREFNFKLLYNLLP